MINVNLSNIVGGSNFTQSESTSTSNSSTGLEFIEQFELGIQNNGNVPNETEIDEETLMLYNIICSLYQNFNTQEDVKKSIDLESINNLLSSNIDENLEFNKTLKIQLNEKTLESSKIEAILDYIEDLTNKNRDILNQNNFDKNLNSIIDKINQYIQESDNNRNKNIYDNLDSIGVLNISKIDEYNSNKNENKDMDCLENIISSQDNDYSNSLLGTNKFNNLYGNMNVSTEQQVIEQPVTEIRQEFIGDDIVKSVKYINASGTEELNVKFNPRDLGEISINISKNNEESNLLITVDNDSVFDLVNKNMEDIKNHLKDTNIDINDVVIKVKSNDENLFSDNLNRGFNQEQNFKQNKSNKFKNNNEEVIEDLTITENSNDDNLDILI